MADTDPPEVDAVAIRKAIAYATNVAVAAHGVKALDPSLWHDVGGGFSCSEADALAALFDAAGVTEHADALRTGHAAQDELDDLHGPRTASQLAADGLVPTGHLHDGAPVFDGWEHAGLSADGDPTYRKARR